MRRLLLPLFLLLGVGISAQEHPTQEKGFAPEKMYQIGDVDHVNVFNGDLIVTLPLGQSFPVDADFGYHFTLTYNSKVWETMATDRGEESVPAKMAFPTRYANAGLGWKFSIGGAFGLPCAKAEMECYADYMARVLGTYESGDGAQHDFFGTLHIDDPDPTGQVYGYTRDGTYLRAKSIASGVFEVEFPDGTVQKFEAQPLFNNAMRLSEIRDRYDNKVTFLYSGQTAYTYTIVSHDKHGRTQTVHFKENPSAFEPYRSLVDYVDFESVNHKTLRYQFNYTD